MDGSGMIQVFFDNNDIRILVPEEYGCNDDLIWEYGDIISGIPASAIYTRTYFTCTNHITK